ncbi:MAG: beta-ketoacyl-ACP synthase II [Oscillospiraceae bacterium]|nr:beta-ketoacyl-ACP synthase II [Oscillospiraceae bacterium]
MMRRVVVTGIGAITPVGNDVPTMWDNMLKGVCGIDKITRFDTEELPVKNAGEVKDFDPTTVVEKRDLRKTDMYTIYALGAASEAMNDSGLEGTVDPKRLGVYVGAGIGGLFTFIENTQAYLEKGPRKVSPHFIPKMIGNIACGQIAIKYNAQGPTLAPVSACATGSNAVGEAFHAIKDGYADAIITGGAEYVVHPLTISGFANMKALSTTEDPKKASIPFDVNRNGFVMGEGAGMLILEEYEHAKARGAKIYAEMVGYGNTCDAHHVTAPSPDGEGLAEAIRIAFKEGNVTDDDVIYINAHGTSTPMNDKTETMAIKSALGEKAYDISVSSTKSMTGHMLGATGAVEAVVSVLAVKDGKIPPTIGTTEVDPECDLDYTLGQAKDREITVAASTNLGFGGHDACVVFKKI